MNAEDPIDSLRLLTNLQKIVESINTGKYPTVAFQYINYRDERSVRRAVFLKLSHEATDHHSKQWIVEAFDVDKKVIRHFAVSEMEF